MFGILYFQKRKNGGLNACINGSYHIQKVCVHEIVCMADVISSSVVEIDIFKIQEAGILL